MKNQYLECGKIINTHGIKGAVKLESWCDSPAVLAGLKCIYLSQRGQYIPVKVLRASVFKQFVIMELDGVSDIDAALVLRDTVVFADRKDFHLEEGDYFIADLLGLPVVDIDTEQVYGTLKEVINRGASDIYVVDTPVGERMMPVVDEFVKEVDPDKGIFVSPIEGMFD